jgi:hypothetical protein
MLFIRRLAGALDSIEQQTLIARIDQGVHRLAQHRRVPVSAEAINLVIAIKPLPANAV